MSEFKDIKVEITKADRRLQLKAGTGAIPEDKIKKAQEKADNNKVDFVPIGSELLSKLAEAIKDAQCNAADNHALMEKLKRPIMRTKASAPMFGYTLAGALAAQLLDFLEAHEAIDDDIIKIVEVHYKTLNYIILNMRNLSSNI